DDLTIAVLALDDLRALGAREGGDVGQLDRARARLEREVRERRLVPAVALGQAHADRDLVAVAPQVAALVAFYRRAQRERDLGEGEPAVGGALAVELDRDLRAAGRVAHLNVGDTGRLREDLLDLPRSVLDLREVLAAHVDHDGRLGGGTLDERRVCDGDARALDQVTRGLARVILELGELDRALVLVARDDAKTRLVGLAVHA